jgi:hypothetical protein
MLAESAVDLHGYYPTDIAGYPYATTGSPLSRIIEQASEMGGGSIRFIHGHGRSDALALPSANGCYLRTPAVPGGGFERPNPFIAVDPDPNALIRIRDRPAAHAEALAPWAR